jgi:uncharacterized membrane protein
MPQTEHSSQAHLNWDAILILVTVLLVSTGVWSAAIRAFLALFR